MIQRGLLLSQQSRPQDISLSGSGDTCRVLQCMLTSRHYPGSGLIHWLFLALACVRMWDFRLVDWANFLLQPSKGHTYGRSPVWMRTCVRKLKSSENRLPQPSNVHCRWERLNYYHWMSQPGSQIYTYHFATAGIWDDNCEICMDCSTQTHKFTFQQHFFLFTSLIKQSKMMPFFSLEQGNLCITWDREETYLERFLSCVYELMPLQLWALNEGFATLCTDVHTRPVGMQVLPHRWVVPEHLGTSLRGRETKFT